MTLCQEILVFGLNPDDSPLNSAYSARLKALNARLFRWKLASDSLLRVVQRAVFVMPLICVNVGCERPLEHAVVQVAFSPDDSAVVVVTQTPFYGGSRSAVHGRVSRISTATWLVTKTTDDFDVEKLKLLPNNSSTWILGANDFDRHGGGNPYCGPWIRGLNIDRFETTNLGNLKERIPELDLILAIASCSQGSLFAIQIGLTDPPFLFDLKNQKKLISLVDLPTRKVIDERTLMYEGRVATRFLFDRSGKNLLSTTAIEQALLQKWEVASGRCVGTFKLPDAVSEMVGSPNGKMAAVACLNGTIGIWDIDAFEQKTAFPFPSARFSIEPNQMTFLDDKTLAVVATDRRVALMDVETGNKVKDFETGEGRVRCVAASQNGRLVAAGVTNDSTRRSFVQVWESASGREVAKVPIAPR